MNQVILTASDARKNIYQIIREAADGLKEYVISLKNQKVVMIAKDEYEALKETAEILSDNGFVKQIETGMKEVKNGEIVNLSDLD